MQIFTTPGRIIITCSKRLSSYLAAEVKELNFTPESVFPTGIELKGTVNDCIKLNLNLRCASQVHYSLRQFRADSPEEVYNVLVEFPWEEVLEKDGYFSVTSNVEHPTVNNNLYVNVKVKDAIVDRMTRISGQRPDSGSALRGAVIYIFWKGEHAEIFLDTSGETLAKHGYRKIPGKAPMLEALASSTLMASRWDRISPLVNPMCGSGTIAIEAVLMATNRRPGLFRENYSFMHFRGYDKVVYDKALHTLRTQVTHVPGLIVIATDISKNAIEIAMTNAESAGVKALIQFKQCDFEETHVPGVPGSIFFNPEYGERLGDLKELEDIYAGIGDFMKKKCPGYLGYIFTGNLDLAKKIGLRASRKIEFYNARLDCRLFEYELYAGTRRI